MSKSSCAVVICECWLLVLVRRGSVAEFGVLRVSVVERVSLAKCEVVVGGCFGIFFDS